MLEESDEHFVLHTVISAFPPPRPDLKAFRIEFDASLWGGGGVLFEDDVPTEFLACRWSPSDFWPDAKIEIKDENSGNMVFFEFLTLLLVLVKWAITDVNVAVLGDNIGALQRALDTKCHGNMGMIARELSWRKAKFCWHFSVGHLPSESNRLADVLSRLYAPTSSKKALPAALKQARDVSSLVQVQDVWCLRT